MLRIEACIAEPKAFNRAAMEKVLRNNLFHVFQMDEAVPDSLRIDDHHRAMLALVEATGLVDADLVLKAGLLECVLKDRFELFTARVGATGPPRGFVALVGADKEVMLELWQGTGFLWPVAMYAGLCARHGGF